MKKVLSDCEALKAQSKTMKRLFSIMSNLQTYYHFKQEFKKMDHHTGGHWLIWGTKHSKDNQLQSLDIEMIYISNQIYSQYNSIN